MKNTLIYFCLLFAMLAVSCSDEDTPLPLYQLGTYELIDQLAAVRDTNSISRSISVPTSLDSFLLGYKINRLPNYQDVWAIRGFTYDGSQVRISVKSPGNTEVEYINSILTDDNEVEALPGYYYEDNDDFFYSCSQLSYPKRGTNPGAIQLYTITDKPCDSLALTVVISNEIINLQHEDTLLVARIRLPYRK